MDRRIKDGIANSIYVLPLSARRQLMYLAFMKRFGHFRRPRTFNEKVNWRILHDRRELLLWTCDKLRMKDEVVRHGVRVPKTFWSGTDLRELTDVELPEHWVLKPNHRSRKVYFGSGQVTDVAALLKLTADWLEDVQGAKKGEWAYTRAAKVFLVEERLGDGSPLLDYKLFTYRGQVKFVQVAHDINRLANAEALRRYYTGDWTPLEVRQRLQLGPALPRPANYDEMLWIAKSIGEPFDFIRVDLYDVNGEIWLGEVTAYPAGGISPFDPPDFDLEMGRPWVLPELDASGREILPSEAGQAR